MVLSDDFYYQPIRLDTINTQVYTDLLAKEGDAGGRGLKVTLTENGVVKNTTGITLNLKWEHTSVADLQGLEPFEVVDLTKGIYKLKYPTNMLQRGTVKAFIQIIDNGGLAGSRNIKIKVDSTVGDDTAIESSNEFAALVTALVKTNHMENLLNEAIANITVDSEVITARNSTAKGKTFTVLDQRIEEIEDDTYFPATNALVSPDFEAATGWTADKATLAVANNVASVTGNGTDAYANLYQSNTNVAVIGDKVYLRVRARVTNALCTSLQLSTTSFAQPVFINNPVANQWYDIYDVIDATATNAILTIRANYADAATANGKVMQVEKPVKINLTTAFGLLTPTVEQMYSLMSQFTNGHFKGTASLSQPALVLAKTLSMEAQFNAAIAGVTVDDETINARVGEDSTTHATLKARLDTEKSTIDQSLVTIGQQLEQITPAVAFDYWTPPVQPDTWAGSTMNGDTFLATFYDPYVGTQPDGLTVTKTNLGKDQSGVHDIFKYVFEPENYTRTFVISSLMHAQEIIGGFSVARFFYYLMEQPDIAPIFRYIRDNVRVVCLPLQNPHGFNQTPRVFANVNMVNINSNFDSKLDPWIELIYDAVDNNYEWNKKGSAPWSEAETRLLRDELIRYKDTAEFWIDCHTGTGWNQDVWAYYVNGDEIYKPKFLEAVDWLSIEWAADKGVTVPQLNNRILDAPTSHKLHYAFGELGIPCITTEYSRQFGGTENGKEDLFAYLRNITNFIIAGLSTENVNKLQLELTNLKLQKEVEVLDYEKNLLTSPTGKKYAIKIDDAGVMTTKEHTSISFIDRDIADNFNRADNPTSLGFTSTGNKQWTTTSETMGIVGNKAKAMTVTTAAASAAFNFGYNSYEASVDITWNTWAGLMFRWTSSADNLQVRIAATGLAVSSAAGDTYGTYAFTPIQGNTYNVKVRVQNDSIIAYLDGVERINITNSINVVSTRVGIKINDLVSTMDNFVVKLI